MSLTRWERRILVHLYSQDSVQTAGQSELEIAAMRSSKRSASGTGLHPGEGGFV